MLVARDVTPSGSREPWHHDDDPATSATSEERAGDSAPRPEAPLRLLIVLCTALARDDPALLDAADLFVLPSQFEGMPLAILEAMAKGLPVIATSVSGIPEALGDAGCLLSYPRKDPALPERLAAAVAGLALGAARRRALGEAARARAQAHFREAPMVGRYLRLIEQTLAPA